MPIMPPMKDNITLMVKKLDEFGKPLLNRNGVAIREPIQTKARVQHSNKVIFSAAGTEITATLEVDIPPDIEVRSGDIVHWVDRFGVLITGPIEQLTEALSANGSTVWFRTAFTV